jgi:hypothetical protein
MTDDFGLKAVTSNAAKRLMASEYYPIIGNRKSRQTVISKVLNQQGVAAMSIKALIFGTATILAIVQFSPHLALAQQNTYVSPGQAQMKSSALVLIIWLGRDMQQQAGKPLHPNIRDVRFPTRAPFSCRTPKLKLAGGQVSEGHCPR